MLSSCINSIGLVVDMIGVILIFLFGISSTLNLKGAISIIAEQEDEDIKKKQSYTKACLC